MAGEREKPRGLVGLAAVGLGVCCGLPLLIGAGFFAGVAGVGFGSWLVVVAGMGLVLAGLWNRRRRQARCDIACSADQNAPSERERAS